MPLPDIAAALSAGERVAASAGERWRHAPEEGAADAQGLHVTYGRLQNASALLLRGPKLIIIGESTPARTRFSLAHELGHWFLHSRGNALEVCTPEDMSSGIRRPEESEANAFAAGLLMPSAWVPRRWRAWPGSINHAQVLASHFQVSLSAAALRYVTLVDVPVIAVVHDGKRVVCVRSHPSATTTVKPGDRIHPDSQAAYAMAQRFQHNGIPMPIPGSVWGAGQPETLYEDSLWSAKFGIGVSLIFLDDQHPPDPMPWFPKDPE